VVKEYHGILWVAHANAPSADQGAGERKSKGKAGKEGKGEYAKNVRRYEKYLYMNMCMNYVRELCT
jgi:hypothetical protein